jgi:ribosomal protein S18 acetylase RimI-like enzyme
MRIAPLEINDRTRFDAFYAIYRVSFPLSEQKPYEELLRMGSLASYTIFTAQFDEEILGFCIMFHDGEVDFYLLEYMAVDVQKRSLGLGSKLFLASLEYLVQQHGLKPLLIEIDSPEKPSNEQYIREKREQFYRKLGCKKIDPFDYILPLNSNEPPPPMELLVYHPHLTELSKEHLKQWLKILYTNVYGCNKNDIRIEAMLEHTPPILNLI